MKAIIEHTKRFFEGSIIARYLISGGLAAITHIAFLYFFTEFFKLWYVFSSSIAFMIAFAVSFSLQKFWTFVDKDISRLKTQFVSYLIIAVINFCLNAVLIYALVDKIGLFYLVAQIIVGLAIAISSFVIYRFIIFKTKSV
jgi:putative flippase GtrA